MYEVWFHLAGHSAARHYVRAYKSLATAKRSADSRSGFGHVYTVIERATGETVHTARI